MEKEIIRAVRLWNEDIAGHIRQITQMAAQLTPGQFYWYILSHDNLQLEFVNEGTLNVLGVPSKDFTMRKFLRMLPEKELHSLEKKEALVRDFYLRFLSPENIPNYKVVYHLHIKDVNGKYRNILHQATSLTVSGSGKVNDILVVHTDITHLSFNKKDRVSFVSLNGQKSYYNISTEKGFFDPGAADREEGHIGDMLTNREVQIVDLLSKGLSAEMISDELDVSFNTIRTHRKNMLQKSGCHNTTELVAQCLMSGVI